MSWFFRLMRRGSEGIQDFNNRVLIFWLRFIRVTVVKIVIICGCLRLLVVLLFSWRWWVLGDCLFSHSLILCWIHRLFLKLLGSVCSKS